MGAPVETDPAPPTKISSVVLVDPFTDGHHLGYARTLAEGLVRKGIAVVFVTWALPSDASFAPLQGCRIVTLAPNDRANRVGVVGQIARSIRCWRRAAREAVGSDCVVHWLYADRQELALAIASRAHHPPAVATMFWPYLADHQREISAMKRAYHRVNRAALSSLLRRGRLSFLAVQSDRAKEIVAGALGEDLARTLVVIPDPSISPSLLPRRRARDELAIAEDQTVLLFFGTMRPDKGPDLLLEALSRIGDIGGWSVILAGAADEDMKRDLIARVERLGLEDRVICSFGFVPDHVTARYFAAADVIVLPYRSTFLGTSGVLQTSAAASLPVLATDVGDVGPAVGGYGLGVLVHPDSVDELERGLREVLATRDFLKASCEDGCRRYAADHSPAKLVHAMVETYAASIEERCSVREGRNGARGLCEDP